jgi:hypothetical protein
MKLIGVISTAVLSLILAVPVYAQEQREQEEQKDKPAQEKEKKAQPEKPAKQEEKGAQEQKNTKPEERNAQEQKNTKPEEKNAPEYAQQARPEGQEQHAAGGRIPADRYKANFGREHSFRVSEGDYRNHRFQYGGYWFGFAAPWPSNWLYTQNVYVVEIDGLYYLCNPSYPGVNVELNVTL